MLPSGDPSLLAGGTEVLYDAALASAGPVAAQDQSLSLIAVTAWLVRRFGSNRAGTETSRGRQRRLAVIDAASVDGRRRLVLIRRDNTEHLMMIGGPADMMPPPLRWRSRLKEDTEWSPKLEPARTHQTEPQHVAAASKAASAT